MADSQINVIEAAGATVALDSKLDGGKQTPQHGSRDGAHETLGAKADAVATTDTGTFSVIALLKRLLTKTAPKSGTAAVTNVASLGTVVDLLAANSARIGASIANDSTSILYIKLGGGASATSYTYVLDAKTSIPGTIDIPDDWTGLITGIWAVANGNARVTERTA